MIKTIFIYFSLDQDQIKKASDDSATTGLSVERSQRRINNKYLDPKSDYLPGKLLTKVPTYYIF
jgi:hypothetical protein